MGFICDFKTVLSFKIFCLEFDFFEFSACYLIFVICYLLFGTWYLVFVIWYLLFGIYYIGVQAINFIVSILNELPFMCNNRHVAGRLSLRGPALPGFI